MHFYSRNTKRTGKTYKHKAFVCKTCGKAFVARENLSKHKKEHSGTENDKKTEGLKKYKNSCDACEYKEDNSYKMELHNSIHKKFRCKRCIYAGNTRKELRMHAKASKHKTFLCKECQKEFNTQNALVRHMREAHIGTKIVCDHCNKVISSRGNMSRHIRSKHSGEAGKIHTCKICGKKTPRKDTLSQHMQDNHKQC